MKRLLDEQLSQEDQTLLSLRGDRSLPWREIARVLHPEGEHLDRAALDRESARLRKRFERAKATLKVLAAKEELIGGEPPV